MFVHPPAQNLMFSLQWKQREAETLALERLEQENDDLTKMINRLLKQFS